MPKNLIDIRGNFYDVWELRALEKLDEYNEDDEEMEYYIIMNREAIQTNYQSVRFKFDTEQERDDYMLRLKEKLNDFDTIQFVQRTSKSLA